MLLEGRKVHFLTTIIIVLTSICQTLSSKYRHDKYVLLGINLSQHLKTMTIKTIQIQFLVVRLVILSPNTHSLMQPNCLDMGNSNAYMQRDASNRSLCPHKLAL